MLGSVAPVERVWPEAQACISGSKAMPTPHVRPDMGTLEGGAEKREKCTQNAEQVQVEQQVENVARMERETLRGDP